MNAEINVTNINTVFTQNTANDEVKRAYVEVAKRLLGFGADATIEAMTPAAMSKIDEFLNALTWCSRLPVSIVTAVGKVIGLLLPRNFSDAYNVINAIVELENKVKKQNTIFMGCYFATKNKYAQELLEIFFYGI